VQLVGMNLFSPLAGVIYTNGI